MQAAARRAEDTLLIHFAGHGLTDPHTDELYLALPDSDRERVHRLGGAVLHGDRHTVAFDPHLFHDQRVTLSGD